MSIQGKLAKIKFLMIFFPLLLSLPFYILNKHMPSVNARVLDNELTTVFCFLLDTPIIRLFFCLYYIKVKNILSAIKNFGSLDKWNIFFSKSE